MLKDKLKCLGDAFELPAVHATSLSKSRCQLQPEPVRNAEMFPGPNNLKGVQLGEAATNSDPIRPRQETMKAIAHFLSKTIKQSSWE